MTGKKKIFRVIALCLMLSLCAQSPGFVRAKTTQEQIDDKEKEKEQTQNELEQTQSELEDLRNTQGDLKTELNTLNQNLTTVSENLAELETQISEKEADILLTELELEEAILVEEQQYEFMKEQIKFMYECGDTLFLELLFGANSYADFLNKADYIEQLSAYDQKVLAEYTASRENTEAKRTQLYQEQADLEVIKTEVAIQKANVEQMVSVTSSSISSYSSQISTMEQEAIEYENLIEQQDADLVALYKKLEEEKALSRLAAQSAKRDISEVVFDEGDRYLLANLIYCEAGGEPYEGQVAVGAVVINRVLSSVYPDTVVGVIYQSGQFSPVGSGRLALALASDKATAKCYQAADEAMSGITNVGDCVYFRTPIEGLTGISIGGHIFY